MMDGNSKNKGEKGVIDLGLPAIASYYNCSGVNNCFWNIMFVSICSVMLSIVS